MGSTCRFATASVVASISLPSWASLGSPANSVRCVALNTGYSYLVASTSNTCSTYKRKLGAHTNPSCVERHAASRMALASGTFFRVACGVVHNLAAWAIGAPKPKSRIQSSAVVQSLHLVCHCGLVLPDLLRASLLMRRHTQRPQSRSAYLPEPASPHRHRSATADGRASTS